MKPKKLTLIFDGDCILCRRSVRWLEKRRTYVDVVTTAALNPQTMAAYGHIEGYGDNMVVVADDGRVWAGPPDAYLVVMWALRGGRALSYLLALPGLRTMTELGLRLVTANRHRIGRIAAVGCERCAVA